MRRGVWAFALGALALSLALAFFASPYASESPDGLERVAEDKGFKEKGEGESFWKFSLLPDYEAPGIGSRTLRKGLAGAAGVALTFGVGLGLARILARAGEADGARGGGR